MKAKAMLQGAAQQDGTAEMTMDQILQSALPGLQTEDDGWTMDQVLQSAQFGAQAESGEWTVDQILQSALSKSQAEDDGLNAADPIPPTALDQEGSDSPRPEKTPQGKQDAEVPKMETAGVFRAMDDFVELTSFGEVFAKQGTNDRIPYAHQAEAMASMDIMDKEEAYSTMLVLPTGGGKTYTASLWLLRHALNRHKKVLWLAHRQMLLDQAAESFQKYAFKEVMPNIRSFHYRIVSGSPNHDRSGDIVPSDDLLIASKDSIGRNLPVLDKWLEGCEEVYLVVDEAHHSTAKTYRKIIQYVQELVPRTKLIGLTATPFRTAESEQGLLAKIYSDGVRDRVAVKDGIGIAYQIGLKELINRYQILSKPVFESCLTNEDFGKNLGADDLERILRLDMLPDDIKKEMANNAVRNKLIIDTYLKKQEEYAQTIVFCSGCLHAITLAGLFNDADVPAACIISDKKDGATGVNISPEENERNLEKFRRGELKVLTNVNILTEGVDLPQTKTVFLARPTVSTILMTQMIGRALRGKEAGGTEVAHIVSFVDNWNEHIAWVNPETLFVDSENDFTDTQEEHQAHLLRLIAISKIEEFASLLNQEVGENVLEKIDFMQWIPVGMYIFTYMLPGDMEQSHEVAVYDSSKAAYEDMMLALPELFDSFQIDEENPSDVELRALSRECRDRFFSDEMVPPYDERDIIHILKYFAIYSTPPKFYTFEEIDRSKLDVPAIAREIYEKDFGGKKERDYLNQVWESADNNMLRLFFGRKIYFLQLYSIEKRKLQFSEMYQAEENVKPGKRKLSELPLMKIREHNPEYEKALRDYAFQASMDENGNCVCARCGKTFRLEVDHVIPFNKGGKSVPDNVQILCHTCNGKKGDKVS